MKNSNSFSILIWANKAKSDVNGLMPLYARVTVMGKRAEISLKKKVNPAKWDAKTGYMKGNGNEVRTVNNHIHQVSEEIFQIYSELQKNSEYISAEEIKNKYTGVPAERRSLLLVFDEHNNDIQKLVGKDYVKATLTKYKTIRSKVAEYILQKYGKSDIYLDTLEYSFVTGFEKYLKIEAGIDHNTTMAYIKRLKRIISLAVHNNWIAYNPFSAFKCTTRKVTREELNPDELETLTNKQFAIKRLEEVRDCFLFSCYTGYAFVDASKLTAANIVIGNDGEMWMRTNRTKTDIAANVPLLPRAIAIINKYKEHDECMISGRILPMKSNQKMNAYLKEIADLCGIKKNLTTHMARHTFATTVTLGNGVPIESVSKMLGHTKITTTQIYARVREQKLSADMRQLRNKLNCNA
ncbi:site-specific integrase [Mucilaginibacter rigui]|uniref:Site-specific integrase n=1 Tax=Mucilaginibacter rigui TaxID=534635 RepID=A0ABR7X4B1_9SPHI|nr:site-specific integrase [Mucilaginibacter rigui]MBD1385414.1 site-specific integrase [Mucilaginibacter rigui]